MRPGSVEDLAGIIADAAASGRKLEIAGGGTRAEVGAPREAERLDMGGFSGVVDYDPAELVLTVRAGTPLAEVEALVASHNQMLAFEPHGAPGSTIGGVVAAGVSGSRRVSRGAVRDHLLGFKAVSGRGEAFVGGAKVVKNVTGYDLPKLAAGSWGRLFALTEVTLKVLPRPPQTLTLAVQGLSPRRAVDLMARSMGSKAEPAAAAHDPSGVATTAIRLEGFGPSVEARRGALERLMGEAGPVSALSPHEASAFWQGLKSLEVLGRDRPLWRLSVPPSRGADLIEALEGSGERWLMDWAGALTWLSGGHEPQAVRAAAEAASGHAMLMGGPETLRRTVPALHPRAEAVMALEARVRRAFDPMGVFETGRFLDEGRPAEGTDAD